MANKKPPKSKKPKIKPKNKPKNKPKHKPKNKNPQNKNPATKTLKTKPSDDSQRLRKRLHKKFINLIMLSSTLWKQHYPEFRKNYQGDKVLGYKLLQKYVKIPKQYKVLKKLRDLTPELLEKIIQTHSQTGIVLKTSLGHKGNRVICFLITSDSSTGDRYYTDLMRFTPEDQKLTLGEATDYATKRLGRGDKSKGTIMIEEFLGDSQVLIPLDYKVYVINGVAKVTSVFSRNIGNRYMVSYDRNWEKIPLQDFYHNYRKSVYPEFPDHLQPPLPSPQTCKKLLQISEKMARKHQTRFCRYDFYVRDGEIYCGEVTPVCGGLKNYDLALPLLQHLLN